MPPKETQTLRLLLLRWHSNGGINRAELFMCETMPDAQKCPPKWAKIGCFGRSTRPTFFEGPTPSRNPPKMSFWIKKVFGKNAPPPQNWPNMLTQWAKDRVHWGGGGSWGPILGFWGVPDPLGTQIMSFEERIGNILAHFGPKGLRKMLGLGQNRPQ